MKPWILLLLATAACGGTTKGNEPTPPTCADDLKSFQACGGDVVGAWTPTVACGDAPNPLASYPECAPSSWKVASIKASGTITFAADGNETDAFDSAISVVMALSDACYSAAFSDTAPGADGCTTLQGKLKDYLDGTGTCSYASGTCTCQATIAVHDFKPRSYVVSGTSLTYPDELGTNPLPFCVSGGSLIAKVNSGEGAFALYELKKN